jgi:hypothetical protein
MKQSVFPSRTADKFVVRLPGGMREQIAEVARLHHRSMNSEIISRLEQSLLHDGDLTGDSEGRLDRAQLSQQESQLIERFRLLPLQQQKALVTLIAHSAKMVAGSEAC